MSTKEFWQGEFGDQYHQRNRVDWRRRIPFWKEIIDITGPRSVLEFGCGPGWNLSAIQRADPLTKVYGVDINHQAVSQAAEAGINIIPREILPELTNTYDLVFTAGALIHVPSEDIESTMRTLASASAQYVLAVEYKSTVEEMVEYRGNADKLWRRPYHKLYTELGLGLIMESGPQVEFDNATAWLFRKV